MYVTARFSWVSWNQSNLSPSVSKLSQAGATCAKLLTSQLGEGGNRRKRNWDNA